MKTNPKVVLWFIGIVDLFILGLALIFGGSAGYGLSFRFHFWVIVLITIMALAVLIACILLSTYLPHLEKLLFTLRRRSSRDTNTQR